MNSNPQILNLYIPVWREKHQIVFAVPPGDGTSVHSEGQQFPKCARKRPDVWECTFLNIPTREPDLPFDLSFVYRDTLDLDLSILPWFVGLF